MFNTNENEQEQEARNNYDESNEKQFKPCLSELYALADQVNENETDIPDLCEFIAEQSIERKYIQAVTSVGKLNSIITYNADGFLVRLSTQYGVSQRLVSAV